VTADLITVQAPPEGVWRIGPGDDPFKLRPPLTAEELANPRSGNRFDSPVGDFGVLYFGTVLNCCFAETLSRFRPDPRIVPTIRDDWATSGFMAPGEVPADWRHRRIAVRANFGPDALFVDVEADPTRAVLEQVLMPILTAYGHRELDVPTIRGDDRRITRWISHWLWERVDEAGRPLYAGIRYCSRLSTDLECWAVFDRVIPEPIEWKPVDLELDELRDVAGRYDLRVY
jgi:hypothetical protein